MLKRKDWLHLSREQSEVPVAIKLQELTDAQPDLVTIITLSLLSFQNVFRTFNNQHIFIILIEMFSNLFDLTPYLYSSSVSFEQAVSIPACKHLINFSVFFSPFCECLISCIIVVLVVCRYCVPQTFRELELCANKIGGYFYILCAVLWIKPKLCISGCSLRSKIKSKV